ncbi:MAG: aminoacyl-tRNA hydrolase [bacterium]|nr:aminoacyl-tRNA hydrolase [bacterium]
MKIIAFLGNPGKKYTRTRHNIGFIIGEYFTKEYRIQTGQKSFSSKNGTAKIEGADILVMFPQKYMNTSGLSIQKALGFYKEKPENLIVVHDEIELSFGDVRTKFGGGHKGHNGLRSIIQETGSPDFHRIRFGVGRPENPNIPVADYVLNNFTGEELNRIEEMASDVVAAIVSLVVA